MGGREELSLFWRMFPSPTEMSFLLLWLVLEVNKTDYWLGLKFNLLAQGTSDSFSSVQFSPVAQSCPTLCDPMNRSTPGLPVHYQLPEFTQTHVHRVTSVVPFSSCPQSLPALGSFPESQLIE